MELFFGVILLMGVGYLLLMIFGGIGESLDLGVDGALESTGLDSVFGLDMGDTGEASGLGCSVIAAFLAGFGAVGLTGTLADWNGFVIVLVALLLGYAMARGVAALLQYVVAQQYTDTYSSSDLIGLTGRVTINSAAGTTGEIMIEDGDRRKYPVKEIDGVALNRGDSVQVIEVDGHMLHVRKQSE
jgi:membrane protein implicated in regulation of membrane protease activity